MHLPAFLPMNDIGLLKTGRHIVGARGAFHGADRIRPLFGLGFAEPNGLFQADSGKSVVVA
jgi:hypothetical protein